MSFDGKLTPANRNMFSRLGISPDLLLESRVQRVSDREAREEFGISGYGDMSGIVFPYIDHRNELEKSLRPSSSACACLCHDWNGNRGNPYQS